MRKYLVTTFVAFAFTLGAVSTISATPATASFTFDNGTATPNSGSYAPGSSFTFAIDLSFAPGTGVGGRMVNNLDGLSYWFQQTSPSGAPFSFSITNRDFTGSQFTFPQTAHLTYPQTLSPANASDLGASTPSGTGVGAGTYFVANVTISIANTAAAGVYQIANSITGGRTSVITDDSGNTAPISQAFYNITIATNSVGESWNGGTGNWNTNGNWTPATVPNNAGANVYDVTIGSGGTDNVTLDISPTIESLVLGGATGTATLANPSGTAETLTITGGLTVNSTGSLLLTSASTVSAGANSSNTGTIDLEQGSALSMTGSLTNSGTIATNGSNDGGAANTVTVTGTLTNNHGANLTVGANNNTSDVANIGSLNNSGTVYIGTGATLNLTNQPSGITDVVSGSEFDVAGTFKAGANSALANLNSIEGTLALENGQSTTATPGSGTLTVSSSGTLDIEGLSGPTTLTISGNLTNLGSAGTDLHVLNPSNLSTLTVTGTLTNNSGSYFHVGSPSYSTSDVANVGTLVNNGQLIIGGGATLNLTNQPNGITDVPAGSILSVGGAFNAGANSALAHLTSVEGNLSVGNGQTITATPNAGTLTVSSSGQFEIASSASPFTPTNLTISGNLSNSGTVTVDGYSPVLTVTGTFTNKTGALFQSSGSGFGSANVATLVNNGTMTLTGRPLNLTGATATNTGTINVGDGSNGGTLKISGSTLTLSGAGKVIMSNLSGNAIIGASGNHTLINKSTIQGSGVINSLVLNNQGTINANQSNPLTISGSPADSNSGTLEATNGGTLQLDSGPFNQTSKGKIVATGTTAQSTVMLLDGAVINGGTLTTSKTFGLIETTANGTATLNGVTNSGGTFQVVDTSTLTLQGTNTNTGTINVGDNSGSATISLDSNVSLNGAGKVILSNNSGNLITGASGNVLTNANTIQGAGNIGNGLLSVTNNGTINANQSTALIINTNSSGLTNNGTLSIGSGDTMTIQGGGLTNFDSGTNTLTGGTYAVTGTLQVNNANIVTNAANITLTGTTSKIIDQSNANALANFATNNGSFTLAGNRSFTTAGNFTEAGALIVNSGSTFTLGGPGMLTQSGGTTTDKGKISASGGIALNGGSLIGIGSIVGDVISSSSAIISPGTSSIATGILKETGNYNQNSGTLDISIKGTTPGSQFDQLNPTTAALSGTLTIGLANGFVPTIGSTFKIMNFSSATGTFSTINGTAINTSEHFTITYQPTDVLLTVVSGASSSGQPAFNFSGASVSEFWAAQAGGSTRGSSGQTLLASNVSIHPAGSTQGNGPASLPDNGSTLLLLIISTLALVISRRRLLA